MLKHTASEGIDEQSGMSHSTAFPAPSMCAELNKTEAGGNTESSPIAYLEVGTISICLRTASLKRTDSG